MHVELIAVTLDYISKGEIDLGPPSQVRQQARRRQGAAPDWTAWAAWNRTVAGGARQVGTRAKPGLKTRGRHPGPARLTSSQATPNIVYIYLPYIFSTHLLVNIVMTCRKSQP